MRRLAHHKVVADEPGRRFRFGWRKPKAERQRARESGADDAVVAFAGLRHVMHQKRKIKRAAVLNVGDDFGRKRKFAAERALFDLREDAHRPDRVFVDGVVVIHVELHHRHDAPEFGDEAAQYAGFVHGAKRGFRRVFRGQEFEKELIGLAVRPEGIVDQLQVQADDAQGLRVQKKVVALGLDEEADQVERVFLEDVRPLTFNRPLSKRKSVVAASFARVLQGSAPTKSL